MCEEMYFKPGTAALLVKYFSHDVYGRKKLKVFGNGNYIIQNGIPKQFLCIVDDDEFFSSGPFEIPLFLGTSCGIFPNLRNFEKIPDELTEMAVLQRSLGGMIYGIGICDPETFKTRLQFR